jgi:hypothetical protein
MLTSTPSTCTCSLFIPQYDLYFLFLLLVGHPLARLQVHHGPIIFWSVGYIYLVCMCICYINKIIYVCTVLRGMYYRYVAPVMTLYAVRVLRKGEASLWVFCMTHSRSTTEQKETCSVCALYVLWLCIDDRFSPKGHFYSVFKSFQNSVYSTLPFRSKRPLRLVHWYTINEHYRRRIQAKGVNYYNTT